MDILQLRNLPAFVVGVQISLVVLIVKAFEFATWFLIGDDFS